jgi:hypothetical protein
MSEMICTCRADGVREVETRRLRIFHRMGLEDMGDLTTAIILSLAFDFQADGEICADMWFGVSLSSPILEKGLFIQCDWPGDGLAALWEQLAEKFPERVSVKSETSPMHVRVMERISAALLSNYESAEGAYREHRAAAHKDDNDCPPCEDCSVARSLSATAHWTLDEAWGARALEKAVEKAFGE